MMPSYRFPDTYQVATGRNRDGSRKQRTRTQADSAVSHPASLLLFRRDLLEREGVLIIVIGVGWVICVALTMTGGVLVEDSRRGILCCIVHTLWHFP